MRYLSPPEDDNAVALVAADVFDTCVSMVKKPALRAQFVSIRNQVATAAADYNAKAVNKKLYQQHTHNEVGGIAGSVIVKIYTLRMVPKTSTGRPTYDRILSAPLHGRCPLCAVGTVNTLDHFLPKTHFPIYSVMPNNLVPACTWCQSAKLEYYPTTAGGQLLHPYFDNVDHDIWLVAEIVVGVPAAFRFLAAPPANWSQEERSRVQCHVKKLNLSSLYSSNAGSRLAEIRSRLARLFHLGGDDAVRSHLREELDSVEADHKNSWVAAMYRAAIGSDWFCNGGFLDT
jgi:hypothetical protein